MRRRTRRNPLVTQESTGNSAKFKEKTYYNYSYSNHNGVKAAVIAGAVILTVAAVFIITKINKDSDGNKSSALNGSDAALSSSSVQYKEQSGSASDAKSSDASDNTKSDDTTTSDTDKKKNPTLLVMPSYSKLDYNTESSRVKIMQERLMELGYLHTKESTTLFGKATRKAVIAFQRQHGLKQTGNAGKTALKLMFSEDAEEYMLDAGAKGDDVFEFQDKLIELGYMDVHTGYYGTDTARAVKDFQSNNGLEITGIADRTTIDTLYNGNAKRK